MKRYTHVFAAVAIAISPCVAESQTPHARLAWSIRAHRESGRDVAFSPDSRILASAGVDSAVRLWSIPDKKLVATLRHPIGVTAIEFTPDGKSLVTAAYDGAIRVWDLEHRNVVRTMTGRTGTIWGLDVSRDGQLIASSGEDKTAKIWRLADGSLLRTLSGHTLNVWKAVFSSDAQYLVTGSFDKTARIWRVSDGSLVRVLRGHTEAIVGADVSSAGNIATSGDDSSIRLWRLADGKLLRVLTNPKQQHVYTVSFSPDGRWLASGGREKSAAMTFWKQLTGNRFKGGNSPTVRLWSVSDGRLQQALADNDDDVFSVTVSPDSHWLAAIGEDGGVRVWNFR